MTYYAPPERSHEDSHPYTLMSGVLNLQVTIDDIGRDDAKSAAKAARAARHPLKFFDNSAALRFVEILREMAVVLKVMNVDELVDLTDLDESLTLHPFALAVGQQHINAPEEHC